MTTKHTPGDWQVIENSLWDIEVCAGGTVAHINQKGKFFPSSDGSTSGRSSNRMLADAHLIAAAPDLLAALEKVMAHNVPLTGNPTHAEQVEFWQDEKAQGRGDADDMLAALAAIAKATGESL